ncbi:hypothetical protein [Bacillus basilensis]|uniref:hypothetical protein n=1 Tax=Bacillus basilensis TaxID=3243721 RepID=UPI003D65CE95
MGLDEKSKECCICGSIFEIDQSIWDRRKTCSKKCDNERRKAMYSKDYTGKRYGKLSVVSREVKNNRSYYKCLCDCGEYVITRSDSLTSGKTKSCGCLSVETNRKVHSKHKDSNTRLYRIYQKMRNRCNDPKNYRFTRYGGRGITVCDEWKNDYESFKKWALEHGYNDKLTIDRINNDGNYEPNNCRWTDVKTQSNNTSRNKYIEYKGETKTLVQWCEELNYSYSSTRNMIAKGDKTIEEIFTRKHIGKGFTGCK